MFEALHDGDVHVAALWPLEVANVLMLAERKRRTTNARVEQFVERLLKQPIEVDSEGLQRAFTHLTKLAKLRSLTVYDAAYLELAVRKGLPLATLGKDLIAAAKAEGIRLVDV